MADKKPPIKGPDIYIGGKPKAKKPGWEAKELDDINRYWKRPIGTREHSRQMSVKRTAGKASSRKRSGAKS